MVVMAVQDVEMEDDVTRSEATLRFHVPNFKNLEALCRAGPKTQACTAVLSPACYIHRLQWNIMVMPLHDEENKNVGIYVQCKSKSESSTWACSAGVVIKILNHNPDKEPLLRKIQHVFHSEDYKWGFVILWSVVLNPEEGYLKENGITLEAHITTDAPYSWGSKNYNIAQTLYTGDFRALLNDPTFADITIVASDEVRRAAHKLVLVARNKVFHAMFKNNMSGPKTCELRMDDINGKVLDDFLQYLYLGCITNTISDPEAMFKLSDKYELPALKLLMQEYLHDQLSLENAAHMLSLAIRYDAIYLKTFTLIFIKKQGVKKVMMTDGWDNLDNCDNLENSAAILKFIYFVSNES